MKNNKKKMPEYALWSNIKTYCYNSKNSRYKDIGAKGIRLCEEWLNFDVFLRDIQPFQQGMIFTRKDKTKDYGPNNFKWINKEEFIYTRSKTHGNARKSEYSIWGMMKQRCYNPKRKEYENYGGRGIRVCDRWLGSFENFYHDIGPRPSKKHSIERKNNDGNYEPENCIWATAKEECRNKRNNHILEFNGQRKTIVEWSEVTGLQYNTIECRINRYKWGIEKTLTTPSRRKKPIES